MSWVYDLFTGTDGANPSTVSWTINEPANTTVDIQSNALRMAVTGGATNKSASVVPVINLYGNPVDVQVDFSALALGADNNVVALVFTNAAAKYVLIEAIQISGAQKFRSGYQFGSGWTYPTTVARANNNGKFRLKRVGTTVETWYQDGGGAWTQLDTITGYVDASVELIFYMTLFNLSGGGNPTCMLDNPVVNDGYINLSGSMTAPSLTINALGQVTRADGALTLPVPVVSSFMQGNWAPYAELTLPVPVISSAGTASPLVTAAFALPPMRCSADTPVVGIILQSLPSMTAYAVGNVALVCGASMNMPRADAAGVLFTGQAGDVSAALPALTAHAGGGSIASVALPSATLSASGFSGTLARAAIEMPHAEIIASGFLNLTLDADMTLPAARLAAALLDGAVGALSCALPEMSASSMLFCGSVSSSSAVLPRVSLNGSGYAQYTLSASMELPVPRLKASMDTLRREAVLTAVVNVKTGGVTTYDDFSFDSYAVFGGSMIGACRDGIYLLEGPDDDGADIAASLRTAPLDLGLPGIKRLRELRLTMTSTGPLTVKVIADEGFFTHYYTAPSSQGALKTGRVKTGRGVKGGYFSVEVQNVDGCDMKIERMEAAADILSRRIYSPPPPVNKGVMVLPVYEVAGG
jgi:hypothetical protein